MSETVNNNETAETKPLTKRCFQCQSLVAVATKKCPYCHSKFRSGIFNALVAIVSIFTILTGLSFIGIIMDNATNPMGRRVLVVAVVDDKSQNKYDLEAIKNALNKGGQIDISVDDAREISSSFDSECAVSNRDGKFIVYGSLLNFIATQGWQIEYALGSMVVFSKSPLINL